MKNKALGTKTEKATHALQNAGASSDEIGIDPMTVTNRNATVILDRPGFDLGGSTGSTTAGTGLGLAIDALENVGERSLPGRHSKSILSIPRWSGPEGEAEPPTFKSLFPKK